MSDSGRRTLVLATRNEHKVHELRQILGSLVDELGLDVVGAGEVEGAPDVPETEVTFEGNARLKAVALARATGMPSVADDSGLAVEVLGGSPGVFSARWSGTLAGGDDLPPASATRPTCVSCSTRCTTSPTSTGPRPSCARRCWPCPTAGS